MSVLSVRSASCDGEPGGTTRIGEEAAFHGVADLLTDTAYLYDGDTVTHGEVPDELADLKHQVHDNLVEGIVVADDELLERYLGGDEISVEELEHTLAKGVARRRFSR